MVMGENLLLPTVRKKDDIEEPMGSDKLKGRQKCCRW
jgi:hypothetical protein